MTRLKFLLVSMAVAVLSATSLAPGSFFEDFESPFATADLSLAPWSVEGGSPTIVSGGPSPSLQDVELNSGDEESLTLAPGDQISVGKVEFDLYIASGGSFRWTAKDGSAWRIARFYFKNGAGVVDIATSLFGANTVADVMDFDTWTRFELSFDNDTEVFSLEIGGVLVYDEFPYNEAGLGHDFSGELLERIDWENVSGNDVLCDNVFVGEGTFHNISGSVGVAGVVMDGLPNDPVSGPSGDYSAQVADGWTGAVTPTLEGYTFDPCSRSYSNVLHDYTDQDYTWSTTWYTISGNAGMDGVTLNGLPGNPITDPCGNYSDLVPYGWNGTVIPSKLSYLFTPPKRIYTYVTADDPCEDYTPTYSPLFENLDLDPAEPNSAETIAITLSGTWPDDEVPTEAIISLDNDNIHFDVLDPCAAGNPVGTPWQLTKFIGPLGSAAYTIFAAILPDTYDLTTWIASLTPAQGAALGIDFPQMQSDLDATGDSIKSARLAITSLLGDLYERTIVVVYNETIVNLAFLKDETESLNRAILYTQALADTGPSTLVAAQASQTYIDVTEDACNVRDDFYALFADSAAGRANPVAAIPLVAQIPAKRQVLEDSATTMSAAAQQVAAARKAIADELRRLRNDAGVTAAMPKFRRHVPVPLPPLKLSPDGTVSRPIFAGPQGRNATFLSLGFDTLDEGSGPPEDPQGTWTLNESSGTFAGAQETWDKYEVPLSTTVLNYAVGDSMYRPPWFASVYGEDQDYYFSSNPIYLGTGGFDYRHPVPRAMILDYLEGAAAAIGAKPYAFVFKGPWEAHPYQGVGVSAPAGAPPDVVATIGFMEHGANTPAVEAFRAYLQDEHGTIANLNAAWGTSYPSFDDIDTPPLMIRALIITKDADDRDVYTAFLPVKRLPGAPTTPLTYEFEKCRKDLYGEYFYDCHQAIKRGDPCYPTASSTSGGIMNEILINSHDDLNMMRRGVDMFGKHPSGGYGWGDSPYMYGLNRYFNKTLVALEYYGWAQQVIGDEFWGKFEVAPGTTTSRVFNAARRDTWHEYSWDRRMLLFYWAQKLVEMKIPPGGSPSDGFTEYTSPLVRPWAGFVAAVKRRVLRTHDVMTNVPIVQPRIAVIHPGVSIINAFPTDGCGSITNDVMDRLIAMQYHFGIVPEELVLNSPGDPDGYDSLDNYDVVILPYVQYFDDGFAAKLMNWVSNGGTLIALGPFGLYDKYGHAITDAATLAYPGATFTYPPPADFPLSWLWQSSGGSPPISGSYDSRSYGSGTVLLTLDGRALYRPGLGEWALTKVTTRPPGSDIVDPGGYSAAQQAFYDTLAAATQRRAWVTSGNVELVARQDSTGQGPLYISLLNWDYNSTLDTDLVVDGEYTNISDLSISGGFPALGTINSGQTTVPIRIGPGEGLMLRFEE